jgi:uncharacterized protein (DUF1697 family)
MPRHIAFLRAINVGGHTVKMETLRQLFESFGLSDVETFITSGNVIFRTPSLNIVEIESQIATGLRSALGYEVIPFLRNEAELAGIASYQAFPQPAVDTAAAFNIAFLSAPLDGLAKQKLMALTTDIDSFAVHDREVYWLCCRLQSQSTFSNTLLEKKLGVKSTLRGVNIVQRLAARMASSGASVDN